MSPGSQKWATLDRGWWGGDHAKLIKGLGLSLKPPIDILHLTQMLEVPVFWNGTMRAQGLLYKDPSKGYAEIHVQKGAPLERFRFTVAHELGHLLLHDFDELTHEDFHDSLPNVKEREANSFAARVLMPTESLLWYKQAAQGPFRPHHMAELGQIFKVSEAVAYYRTKNMGWLET